MELNFYGHFCPKVGTLCLAYTYITIAKIAKSKLYTDTEKKQETGERIVMKGINISVYSTRMYYLFQCHHHQFSLLRMRKRIIIPKNSQKHHILA